MYNTYFDPSFIKAHENIRESVHQVISKLDTNTRIEIGKQITLTLEELICPTYKSRKGNIPRPQNPFVIYRRNTQSRLVNNHPKLSRELGFISKYASDSWKKEPQYVREIFEKIADLAKEAHKKIYPTYKYKPTRFPKYKNQIELKSRLLLINESFSKNNYNGESDNVSANNGNDSMEIAINNNNKDNINNDKLLCKVYLPQPFNNSGNVVNSYNYDYYNQYDRNLCKTFYGPS